MCLQDNSGAQQQQHASRCQLLSTRLTCCGAASNGQKCAGYAMRMCMCKQQGGVELLAMMLYVKRVVKCTHVKQPSSRQ
jgi:hypothetical protein